MAKTRSRGCVLSPEVLEAALVGLEMQRSRADEQIATVRRMLGPQRRGPRAAASNEAPSIAVRPKKWRMSAAARRRIAAAQKKRWAEFKKKRGSRK